MAAFFSDHYDILRDYSDRIAKFSPSTDEEARAAELVTVALKAATFNRQEYDALTPYTTARQGKALLEVLQQPIELQTLERASLFLASFIREASLVRESRSDSEQIVLDHYLGSKNEEEWAGYHEDYLRYVLPSRLFEANYKSIGQARADAENLIHATEARANELESRIEGYRAQLKRLESEYNFVGLSHAFNGLLREKRGESRWSISAVFLLGAAALAIPFSVLISYDSGPLGGALRTGWSPTSVGSLLAVLGLEVVMLYFFRIALKTYLLVRTQVTNLQLRVALCTFIEGYLEFAAKAQSAKASVAIQGFETLTFSSLPVGDSTLPPTLEGIEQLIKLIQAARSS